MKNKKLVYNKGINNMLNMSNTTMYRTWITMLKRCYNNNNETYQTYNKIYVCNEWLNLSNFSDWYNRNYIENFDMDKDLYIPNNLVYSSETCLFVPHYINMLITKNSRTLKHLAGVYKSGNKYACSYKYNGKQIYLGTYNTEYKAHQAYIKAKQDLLVDIADTFWKENEKIAIGLYRHAEHLIGNDWTKLPY